MGTHFDWCIIWTAFPRFDPQNYSGSTFPARWIHLGSFTFQTSDFARLSVIIYLAGYLDTNHRKITDFTNGLLPPVLILAGVCSLIVLQPDFSTAMVIALIGFVILFIGGAKISQLAACGSVIITVSIPAMMLKSYRLDRILAWFNMRVLIIIRHHSHSLVLGMEVY